MMLNKEFTIHALASPPSKVIARSAIQVPKMDPCKFAAREMANSCPFSHVETTPKRASGRKSLSSTASSMLLEGSVITDMTDYGKESKSILNKVTSAKTSLRVRVINEFSNLFKEVLVEIRHDLNLFDLIYDNKSVKKANIRKWDSDVTKQVKSGSHEIKCSIWDDEVNSPCHAFTIEDMKETNTRQLYHLVGPESDLIKMKLQCVEKKTVETHPSSTAFENFLPSTQKSSTFASSIIDEMKEPGFRSLERSAGKISVLQARRTESRLNHSFNHPPVSSNDRGSFRCPFSGIKVDESVFQQFRDRDTSCRSRGDSNNSNPANDTVSDLDENDNSTIRTVRTANETYPLVSAKSFKTTMRVKITNETSRRHKDLVVDIKSDLFVHESVYDHKSVKSAQVRKWTSEIVKDVKNKVKEIQCVVLDESLEGKICGIFRIDELKRLSTKDLFYLVPKSDPVQLMLRCVCVDTNLISNMFGSSALNNHSSNDELPKVPSRITTHIDDDLQTSISGNSKRSCRPNHMNLSALTLNESFSSLNGNKNFSHSGQNASFISDKKLFAKPSCLKPKSNSLTQKYISEPYSSAKKPRSHSLTPKYISELHSTAVKPRSHSLTPKFILESHSTAVKPRSHSLTPKYLLERSSTADNSFSLEDHRKDKLRHTDGTGGCESLKMQNAKQNASTLLEVGAIASSRGVAPIDVEENRCNAKQIAFAKSITTSSNAYNEDKLSEFKRLCRSKKSKEFQSQESFENMMMPNTKERRTAASDSRNAFFDTSVSDKRNSSFKSQLPDLRNTSSKTIDSDETLNSTAIQSNDSNSNSNSSAPNQNTSSDSVKISRFLAFSAKKKSPAEGLAETTVPPLDLIRRNSLRSVGSLRSNIPPIAEIEVVKSSSSVAPVLTDQSSIPLSGDLVKEVFPYHVVINEDFDITQIGNSLARLMENEFLIGKCISDILTITGPIPSFGKNWDWKTMDKMKEKTIFLEGLYSNSTEGKSKIKGSIIELAKAPQRQVMLALSPNVKNLSELEDMNLSMTDLPLHSCQRDAVLLGEHSKSEVKLTNHLDQLHRDLIDSMEKQIEDRTNELATANTNLESANAQLAVQSAKQLEHFACMSHEIRTPLNCIVGMSSLLLEDSEGPFMDPIHADSVRMINTSGELLKAVVDDVLDYAKLESGSFEVDIKSTKLQDTLDSVLYSISQKVQDKNIRLRTHFTPTVPEYIETDSRRLQQVLFNLLGNAGKFSKADSVIDLSVSLVKAPSQNDSNEKSANHDIIRFSVRDYGKGIEKKDFETIFQPFSQASKETQNIYGGTGLGLSITSKLVHRLGGTISLDSEFGKFADFTVDLPMNGKPVEVETISNSLKNTTIVFVEPKQTLDNPFLISPFKAEPVPIDSSVVDVFGLNIIRCNSVNELKEKISLEKNQQHFGLLIEETLHQSCSSKILDSILGQSRYSLMTYGANFLVEKTRASHFKSLTGLFPATLLKLIAKKNSAQKASRLISSNGISPTLATGNQITPNSGKKPMGNAIFGCPYDKTMSTPSKTPASSRNTETKQNDYRKNLKILYAEDNLVNQKVLSRVLNRSGITDITIVDNGKKAVDISEKVKYDCILLDMQMPVMGGMEACEIIMERDPDTIIVFVTAHALDEFKVHAKAAGARAFISKPFRKGDIDDVLKEIYGK